MHKERLLKLGGSLAAQLKEYDPNFFGVLRFDCQPQTSRGIEPLHSGFADRRLTTWQTGHKDLD